MGTSTAPLAQPSDVEDIWRPLTSDDEPRITNLILKASTRLRQVCPFDIDERITLFGTDPTAPTALDPVLVADLVATKVKNFLVNPEGVATASQTDGPFAQSATYVNRYDKTGSDIRGSLQFTDSDIDQIRPAVPGDAPWQFQVGIAHPQLLVPDALWGPGLIGPVVVPDVFEGSGSE